MHALHSRVTIGVALFHEDGSAHMADLAYAVLLIGIFAVLALALRGLERL
jgi:hypothetical protein